MHALGDPRTMQDKPTYDDVVLDVYDVLEARIAACERAGIARARLIVDPGIGFGKTLAHNLALLGSLSLFHGLGCGVLLGASRKSFIGQLTGAQAGRSPAGLPRRGSPRRRAGRADLARARRRRDAPGVGGVGGGAEWGADLNPRFPCSPLFRGETGQGEGQTLAPRCCCPSPRPSPMKQTWGEGEIFTRC